MIIVCYILTAPVNQSFYIHNRRRQTWAIHGHTIWLHNSSLLGFTWILEAYTLTSNVSQIQPFSCLSILNLSRKWNVIVYLRYIHVMKYCRAIYNSLLDKNSLINNNRKYKGMYSKITLAQSSILSSILMVLSTWFLFWTCQI